jgi:primosomal protein N' (replication factor Y)
MLISVAVPVPIDKTFDYYLESDEENLIGRRVLVPFGKNKLVGVIVNTSLEDKSGLKIAISLLDEKPVFNDKLIKFLTWISDYYLCSLGETFKAAAPPDFDSEIKSRVNLIISKEQAYAIIDKSKKSKKTQILELLINSSGDLSAQHIKRVVGGSNILANLKELAKLGYIDLYEETFKEIKGRTSKYIKMSDELFNSPDTIESLVALIEKKTPKRALAINLFRVCNPQNEFVKLNDFCEKFKVGKTVIDALIESEVFLFENLPDELDDKVENRLSDKNELNLELSAEQQKSVEFIADKIVNSDNKPTLLHGVTGSGKTLVYMRLIKQCLDLGKTALYMVPEISLTPQLIDRFKSSFPEGLSIIHSRMSPGEKAKEWKDILSGKNKIVIGARSALFAPLDNLGLIVVDEEHDGSYKQDSPAPRYNARDSAIVRANIEKAAIVLGSATPSIETMFNARRGKYDLCEISSRCDGAVLPTLKTIDMLDAKKSGQTYKNFSKELLEKIEDRLTRKEGIILFHNRRGFSSYLQCQDCGYIPQCEHCSVKLTYHKSKGLLKCHYCGYTEKAYKACTLCGSTQVEEMGCGTQMIEEDLIEYFSGKGIDCKIERMDLDTTSKKGSHRRILERFASGATDILVGTQMVAKGLDFERVSLVGIVNADLQLFIPDFRTNERAFQLISQVVGRAGRSGKISGEAIIQTSRPDHVSIKSAAEHSYNAFYEQEIKERLAAAYPPFSRFISIEISSQSIDEAEKHAWEIASSIQQSSALLMLGPTAPHIERIREYYRRIIIIKNIKKHDPSGQIMRLTLRRVLNNYFSKHASSKVRIKIDIDSFNSI